MDRTEEVYEFRPIGEGPFLRYANGEWIHDDGEYDLAFVSTSRARAYGVQMPYYKNILWKLCIGMNWSANVRKHPKGNAWHYQLKPRCRSWGKPWDRDKSPNEIAYRSAMHKTYDIHSCANGSGPEFEVGDEYIRSGKIRVAGTKAAVAWPKIFKCMHCGDVDYLAIDPRFKKTKEPA